MSGGAEFKFLRSVISGKSFKLPSDFDLQRGSTKRFEEKSTSSIGLLRFGSSFGWFSFSSSVISSTPRVVSAELADDCLGCEHSVKK